jgi:hypothetical protein
MLGNPLHSFRVGQDFPGLGIDQDFANAPDRTTGGGRQHNRNRPREACADVQVGGVAAQLAADFLNHKLGDLLPGNERRNVDRSRHVDVDRHGGSLGWRKALKSGGLRAEIGSHGKSSPAKVALSSDYTTISSM